MTKMEAYNCMIDGHAISHKNFNPNEFLYMDENHIIRDENGDEFESTWDVRSGDEWETDWYICKNRGAIVREMSNHKKLRTGINTIPYIEKEEYIDAIANETIESKIERALPFNVEDGSQIPFSNQDGFVIDQYSSNIGCDQLDTCKKYANKGTNACLHCRRRLKPIFLMILLIFILLSAFAFLIFIGINHPLYLLVYQFITYIILIFVTNKLKKRR